MEPITAKELHRKPKGFYPNGLLGFDDQKKPIWEPNRRARRFSQRLGNNRAETPGRTIKKQRISVSELLRHVKTIFHWPPEIIKP
jgi:hypothetical protein